MVTKDELKEVYREIGTRVKWRVFIIVVLAFSAIITIAGPIVWDTAAATNENAIRLDEHKRSSGKANTAYRQADKDAQEARDAAQADRESLIFEQLEKLNVKLDTVIERIHLGS